MILKKIKRFFCAHNIINAYEIPSLLFNDKLSGIHKTICTECNLKIQVVYSDDCSPGVRMFCLIKNHKKIPKDIKKLIFKNAA